MFRPDYGLELCGAMSEGAIEVDGAAECPPFASLEYCPPSLTYFQFGFPSHSQTHPGVKGCPSFPCQ